MLSIMNLGVAALLGTANALPNNVEKMQTQSVENTWDYVIVGGGVTGLVVANRLTEDKKSKLAVS
jgi:NADH dehydrogenase FAD-containing subunit